MPDIFGVNYAEYHTCHKMWFACQLLLNVVDIVFNRGAIHPRIFNWVAVGSTSVKSNHFLSRVCLIKDDSTDNTIPDYTHTMLHTPLYKYL